MVVPDPEGLDPLHTHHRRHPRVALTPTAGLKSPFAVELEGRLVGRTTLYDLVPGLRVEVGNTIYAREVWGTRVNPTAKLLLFAYAFDQLGVGRVALRCDH